MERPLPDIVAVTIERTDEDDIMSRHTDYIDGLRDFLEENEVKLEDICLWLSGPDLNMDLPSVKSFSELFTLLKRKSSFWNYKYFKKIHDKYCPELTDRPFDYPKRVRAYFEGLVEKDEVLRSDLALIVGIVLSLETSSLRSGRFDSTFQCCLSEG